MKRLFLTTLFSVFFCYFSFSQTVIIASSGGTGWKRIASIAGAQGRGFGRLTLYTEGGAFTPIMSHIEWFHDWSTVGGISIKSDSKNSPYWSAFRITNDGTNSYIEVNFTIDLTSMRLQVDDYGWRPATLYSGTLPDGGGTVKATTNAARFSIENSFIVQYNGNVGIGTGTPQAKLAVNGTILANEIKVKTDISVPDYVFEDGYKLNSLKEIETYVTKHKHLPEVPSAREIRKEGLNLAEMNLLLLKKVEELTLHLIQQQKVIEKLEARTKDLKP